MEYKLMEMEMEMNMSNMSDMDPTEVVNMMVSHYGLPGSDEVFETMSGDHLCLNTEIHYMNYSDYLLCNIEFDMLTGMNVLNSSYIEILNIENYDFQVGEILINHLYMLDALNSNNTNCTLVPIMKIKEIIIINSNRLRLYISEPKMTEYINIVESNMTKKNLYNLNSIKSIEPISMLESSNITNSSMSISQYKCYEYNENGEIIGEVDYSICEEEMGMSIVEEMGSKYGDSGFISKESLEEGERRRLLFGWVKKVVKVVVNVVKEVVEKVVDFVETVIDIITGDVDERFSIGGLYVTESASIEFSGVLKEQETANGKGTLNGNGEFKIEAGANFGLETYIDFIAKYQLFDINPSFDEFKVVIGSELTLNTYLNIDIKGELNIEYEIFKVGKRKLFFIGPIPVIVNFFSDLTFFSDFNFNSQISMTAGIEPINIEFGAQYIKGEGWNKISNANLVFNPYFNIGSVMDDTESDSEDSESETCFETSVVPGLDLRFGVVLYELLTIYTGLTFDNDMTLSYPYNCDIGDHCNNNPSLAFQMTTGLAVRIGIELGSDELGMDPIEAEYELWSKDISSIENCINTFIAPLFYSCCGIPDTLFPTRSPTPHPTFNPTSKPTLPNDGYISMICNTDSTLTGWLMSFTKGCTNNNKCNMLSGMDVTFKTNSDYTYEDRTFKFTYCRPNDDYWNNNLIYSTGFGYEQTNLDRQNKLFECPTNYGINWVTAYHNFNKGNEDRIYTFECSHYQNTKLIDCAWNDYSTLGVSFAYTCPNNGILTAVNTIYYGGSIDDRRFRLKCCNLAYDF